MLKVICINGRYCPKFVCDVCGQWITNAHDGLVLFTQNATDDGAEVEHVHAHKGLCDRKASATRGDWGTDELATHLVYVLGSLGMDATAVKREYEVAAMLAQIG